MQREAPLTHPAKVQLEHKQSYGQQVWETLLVMTFMAVAGTMTYYRWQKGPPPTVTILRPTTRG
jgi:hypothetical protein